MILFVGGSVCMCALCALCVRSGHSSGVGWAACVRECAYVSVSERAAAEAGAGGVSHDWWCRPRRR